MYGVGGGGGGGGWGWGGGDELVFHCVSTVCHAMQLYGCRLFSSLRRCGVMENKLVVTELRCAQWWHGVDGSVQTPSITFRHLPLNSAISSYDTIEGAPCLSPRIHHTLSIAFRHRPPNSAVTSYDTIEEAQYLSPRICLPKSPLSRLESLFRHLPPNSARTGHSISSSSRSCPTDAVGATPKGLGTK